MSTSGTKNKEADDVKNLEVNHEQFKQTQLQLEHIKAEINETQPLTSDLKPLDELRMSYEAGSNFAKGVLLLAQKYESVRIIRGDGDCYYRAFLYSICDKLFQADKEEQERVKTFGMYVWDKIRASNKCNMCNCLMFVEML